MGTLKPDARYVYERNGGTVYAREIGAPHSERKVIGYDWELDPNPSRVKGATLETVKENQLWHEIRVEALTNPALQEALDRAKILYHLSKNNGQE